MAVGKGVSQWGVRPVFAELGVKAVLKQCSTALWFQERASLSVSRSSCYAVVGISVGGGGSVHCCNDEMMTRHNGDNNEDATPAEAARPKHHRVVRQNKQCDKELRDAMCPPPWKCDTVSPSIHSFKDRLTLQHH